MSHPDTGAAAVRTSLGAGARTYVVVVTILGLTGAAATLYASPLAARIEFAVLCALAVILGSRTVRLWSTVELSVALPFIYAGLLQFGAASAVLISLLAALGACVVRKRQLDLPRILLNMSVISGTTVAACWAYLALGGRVGLVEMTDCFWPLVASTCVYYALNTTLISGIIHLVHERPLARVWMENFFWSAPSYFTGSFIGLMIVLLLNRFGMMAFALALPPSLIIYVFYRTYQERMELQRRQIEQFEAMNRELERKVEERTRELTAANRKLEDSNLQLQTTNRMKSQFLANMSHELRTPLNAIIGFSELLVADTSRPLDPGQHEYIRDILSSGRHLLDLINDLLDLSKIEAGKMDLYLEDFHIEDVIEAALVMITPIAARKRIELSVSIAPRLPTLSADPAKVKQILYNLLSNAVKFTPEDGRVGVTATSRGGCLSVAVSDTGIGIAEGDREKIFSEFIQLDGSYARRYQGTGLGLALVKRFVEMHGGRIEIDSVTDQGSCFTFELPVKEPVSAPDVEVSLPRPGERDPIAAVGPASALARTILVVEDNQLNAKLVRRVLQSCGHRVVEARSGREAMEKARASRPDLILMDIQLPDMDGLEATRSLKADPITRCIPTVALTAHAMKGDDERARLAGCSGYIAKPIDVARFPAMVEEFFKEGILS
ncbi:MAG TPA: ATP-binding protein [Candidatus Polarisedimenticolia bacterium]|jgi:signal transduction histidine kinase/CheY-like chemotaxis protein